LLAEHSAAPTFQRAAAARTSVARAEAAALRKGAHQRIPVELFVRRGMFQYHAGEIGIELLGEDHGDGGVGSLAHLHLRHHQGGAAAAVDADEGVGDELAGGLFGRLAAVLARGRRQVEGQHKAAGERTLQQGAPAHAGGVGVGFASHGRLLVAFAASLMASRMRT
jgi:hypothetical protein